MMIDEDNIDLSILPQQPEALLQHEDPLPPLGVSSLGEVLSAARVVKNMTLEDVSNHLRLSIKQISAIENNTFDALPDPMITRGFIRNYARLLEVDAEPLLASYRARVPDKAQSTLSVRTSLHQKTAPRKINPYSWMKYALASIVFALLVGVWLFYGDYVNSTLTQMISEEPAEPVVVAPVAPHEPVPETALPASERRPNDGSAMAGGAATDVTNSSSASPTPSSAPQNTVSAPTTITTTATALPAEPIVGTTTVVTMPKKVEISTTARTWVSITDKSGKTVFEQMLYAGDTESFEGELPFNVVIGNVKATTLTLAGKSVDLASHADSNVARFVLE